MTAPGPWLARLQNAAYRAKLGTTPPVYRADDIRKLFARNQEVLRAGGEYEREIAAKVGDDARARSVLALLRRGQEQVSAHRDVEAVLAEYVNAPTPYVDPFHHSILTRIQRQIEILPAMYPALSFGRALADLAGRVTVSTLPTGQVNARTVAVPGGEHFLILFDPAFFDFVYYASNNFAQAINPVSMKREAMRFMETGESRPLTPSINYGDESVSREFLKTFEMFLHTGLPPLPTPYDEGIFRLAEHLREGAVLFICAHEYAHILLGHLTPDEETAHSVHAGPGSPSWDAEMEADVLAFALVDAVSAARLVRPVRHMGAYFFLFSAMLIEAAFEVADSGRTKELHEFIAPPADDEPATAHPVAPLRVGILNDWLERKFPTTDFRGSHYHAAVIAEVASSVWHHIQPRIAAMRTDGVAPRGVWTAFDSGNH
ncbi:ImmA/IrrE family metallo-endopeptidase [Actinoplanes sp. NPDC051513]|uniref:ImmA/IrrE family metallo-endopeptidase n=1 Tax=Actinoplanes sp. NPDC051513 TaxID=3363908 RepID=UPI0037B971F4